MDLNLAHLVTGMVLPFFAMVGSFLGLVMTAVANPILYRFGVLYSWGPTNETIYTLFNNNMDFYFSFSLGTSIAVALAGFYQMFAGLRAKAKQRRQQRALRLEAESTSAPPGRGDIPFRFILGTYVFTSSCYILVSGWLIDWHPGVMTVLMFFAYLYTPMLSYVTARLEGMAGQVVQIPFVREAAFILSGYKGVAVWFIPVPIADYGTRTVFWRQAELTGTRFWSIWKAELFLVPIVIATSILFSQFIWSLAEIPGPQYPFTERMWEFNAANASIIYSSTLGRFSAFEQAFRAKYIAAGAGFGLMIFCIMWVFHLPIMMFYGMIRGLHSTLPHVILPQFIGAMIGRFYFERKMGLKWRQYVPVVAAGFSCGMGLITVLGVGANFLAKAVIKVPF
jgi:hypothetical protein